MLGGGLNRYQGMFGFGVDNMLSVRLVTAEGKSTSVSATKNQELWWALRGAGHQFGIVTSLTMKAYPQINDGTHFTSLLIFTPDKIESVVNLIEELDFQPEMACNIFFMCAPPTFQV
jgi:FAD/FMN-containing dehydrogenase